MAEEKTRAATATERQAALVESILKKDPGAAETLAAICSDPAAPSKFEASVFITISLGANKKGRKHASPAQMELVDALCRAEPSAREARQRVASVTAGGLIEGDSMIASVFINTYKKEEEAIPLSEMKSRLIEGIVKGMREDGLNWAKSWSPTAGLPVNASTGKVYKGENLALLMGYLSFTGAQDPRFCTRRQAEAMGLKIADGACGLQIEHWRPVGYLKTEGGSVVARPQPKTDREWDAFRARSDTYVKMRRDKPSVVYNGKDVEGLEPPVKAELEGTASVDFLIKASPCPVKEQREAEAYYVPSRDEIHIPLRSQFESAEAMSRVLLHEQCHATGAPSRLNRRQNTEMGSDEYAFEELVAEMGAALAAAQLGVELPEIGPEDASSAYWENHLAYVQHWAGHLTDDEGEAERVVLSAASQASRAADWLMGKCFKPELARREELDKKARLAESMQTATLDYPDLGQAVHLDAERVDDTKWRVESWLAMPTDAYTDSDGVDLWEEPKTVEFARRRPTASTLRSGSPTMRTCQRSEWHSRTSSSRSRTWPSLCAAWRGRVAMPTRSRVSSAGTRRPSRKP